MKRSLHQQPANIHALLKKREKLRANRQFAEADRLRNEIEVRGYAVTDKREESVIRPINSKGEVTINQQRRPGLVGFFGSGEMSPTGRRIHEFLLKDFSPPVNIALLETPAGYEVNPHNWYQKLENMLTVGLANFRPVIVRIEALRKGGKQSVDDEVVAAPLLLADYIHTGAGSPTYAVKHLANSLVYDNLTTQHKRGASLSFASAAAIAIGRYALPVYEIYKVGEDLRWYQGLNFFGEYGLNITVIPHWDNTEGGRDLDTSRCFMGEKRFARLVGLLPAPTTLVGIAEQTALIIDLQNKACTVLGNGRVTIIRKNAEKHYRQSQAFSLSELS